MEINICPDWLLAKLGVPPPERVHVAMLVSAFVALAGAPILMHVPHLCLMKALLGLPCPGCGALHAVDSVMRFHLVSAWQANPAGVALALLLVFQIAARPVVIAWARAERAVSRASKHGSQMVMGLLLAVWVMRLIWGGP